MKLSHGFSGTVTGKHMKGGSKGGSMLYYFPSGQNCKENLEQ